MDDEAVGKRPDRTLDRLFWLRGTLATVFWGPSALGMFLIPKWVDLWKGVGVDALPFPLGLLALIHTALRASPLLALLWFALPTGAAIVSWLPARSRAQAVMEWGAAAIAVLFGLLYAMGLAANGLAIVQTVTDLSTAP